MDHFRISTGNPFESLSSEDLQRELQSTSSRETTTGSIAPVNTLVLPADRSQRISGVWNKSVAFFTKGIIGKKIVSKTYLAGRKIIGENIGGPFLGFIGSYVGKWAGAYTIPTLGVAITAAFANDPRLQALGISKTAFATTVAASTLAMQMLYSEYLEETGTIAGNYLFGVIGSLVGEMVLSYITDPPKVSLEEFAQKYLMNKGSSLLMQSILPNTGISGAVRDKLIFEAIYNKDSIMSAYSKASSAIKILRNEDIAKFAQITIQENLTVDFFGKSTFISLIPRLIRVGVRSLNKYSALTQTSAKIVQAQQAFRVALSSSNLSTITTAKKRLIQTIKKEMQKHFSAIGIASTVTDPIFNRFLGSELSSLDIAGIEERFLGFAVSDDLNSLYSKELLQIHAKCLFAFALMHISKKSELPKGVEILFFQNLVQIFMSHYIRVAPESKLVEYTGKALDTFVDTAITYIISTPTIIEPAAEELLPEEASLNTPLTETQKNALRLLFAFIASMFLALCRYLYSAFTSNSYIPQENIGEILSDATADVYEAITTSDPIELEEDDEDTTISFLSFDSDHLEEDMITGRITEITEDEEEFFLAPETIETQ